MPPPPGRVIADRMRRGTTAPGSAIVATPSGPVTAVAPVGAGAGGAVAVSIAVADSSSTGTPATGAAPPTWAVRVTVRRVSVATAAACESVYTGWGATVSARSGT